MPLQFYFVSAVSRARREDADLTIPASRIGTKRDELSQVSHVEDDCYTIDERRKGPVLLAFSSSDALWTNYAPTCGGLCPHLRINISSVRINYACIYRGGPTSEESLAGGTRSRVPPIGGAMLTLLRVPS